MPWTPRLLETSRSILWSLGREVFPPRRLGQESFLDTSMYTYVDLPSRTC